MKRPGVKKLIAEAAKNRRAFAPPGSKDSFGADQRYDGPAYESPLSESLEVFKQPDVVFEGALAKCKMLSVWGRYQIRDRMNSSILEEMNLAV